MKTCEKCKKVFDDDMSYCPYCGEKVHDYHEEMKDAMNDLLKAENEDIQVSTDEKGVHQNEEAENKMLNRILMGLIAALTVIFLGGGYWLTNRYFFPKQESEVSEPKPNVPVVNEEKPDDPDIHENENSIQEPIEQDKPIHLMDQQLQGEYVVITSISALKQEDGVRLDIMCDAQKEGQIFLSDGANLMIGPIDLHQGSNSFYYTLNIHENSQYTLTFEMEDGKDEMMISSDMLQKLFQQQENISE